LEIRHLLQVAADCREIKPRNTMCIYIVVTVQVRDAGEPLGPPVTEHISLGRFLAGLDVQKLGLILESMIKCCFLDDEVLQAAIAAIWYGEAE
jgi:hypothetical protein